MSPWNNTDFPPLTRSTRPLTQSTRPLTQSPRSVSYPTRPPLTQSSSILGSPPGGPHNSRGGGSHRGSVGGAHSRGWWGGPRGSDEVAEQVCEKFDELEVIEESNELAKNSGYVMNDNDDKNVGDVKINFDAYGDIPVEASGENVPKAVKTFGEIDLGEGLNENIRRCKYVNPTPIQCHAIPIVMAGRDLMACAQTGSGKTAAFCFPIIAGVLSKGVAPRGSAGRGRVACPVALIMSPTRELASQIHDEAKKFSHQTGVRVVVAYGGTPMAEQVRNLERGVDILVATPGRLVDMIERGRVSLRMVRYLALDEADRMLDMGFEPQIRKIVQKMDMPPPGTRQTMLFSATFPSEIQELASDFLSNYIFLTVGKVGSSTDLIDQKVELVDHFDKRKHLKDLLVSQRMNGTHGKHALTIIFVETKRGVDDLAQWLSHNGFPSTAIHGDKMQLERERALRSFKSGATPIMVATDVAARGLDIPCVAHVINFELPRDIENYVHRIGRTGRAGKSGKATAFFTVKDLPISKALADLMEEANQVVPSWLLEYAQSSSSYGGGGNSRRRGGKFGGRDYRNNDRAASGYSGYSDYSSPYGEYYSSAYTADKSSGTGATNSSAYAYGHTTAESAGYGTANSYTSPLGYESIEASGWD